ncbi:MAG: hypothetical protein ABIV06_10525 [Thermoanaerobaculia bacterium]
MLTPAQHAAMEGAAPFLLEEQVVLASGLKLAGTRARVYSLLRQTAERGERHRIGQFVGPAGWVPNYYIRRAWSGGSAGDRRLRDLRERGIQIETTRFAEDSAVVLYRWVADPEGNRFPNSSGECRPLARGGLMGRSRTETQGIDAPAADRPANRLRFWTSVGHPGSDLPNRVNVVAHGATAHPLALSPALLAEVIGGLPVSSALAAHDQLLRRRYPDLRAWLAEGGEHVLWLEAAVAETINPLPMLVEILGKCGAEYLGDWQQRPKVQQQGVA